MERRKKIWIGENKGNRKLRDGRKKVLERMKGKGNGEKDMHRDWREGGK